MNQPEKLSPAVRPLCFLHQEDWIRWLASHRYAPKSNDAYCEDCNPVHQGEMIRSRRCAFPGTTFEPGRDGEIVGRRPDADASQADLFGDDSRTG